MWNLKKCQERFSALRKSTGIEKCWEKWLEFKKGGKA